MVIFKLVLAIAAMLQPTTEQPRKLTISGADSMWARTYAVHDTASARMLMADSIVITGSNGKYKSKAQEMADIRPAPGLAMEYFRTRDVKIYDYKNTAVVKGVAEWAFTFNGKRSEYVRNYTAVYARGGPLGWQMVTLFIGLAQ